MRLKCLALDSDSLFTLALSLAATYIIPVVRVLQLLQLLLQLLLGRGRALGRAALAHEAADALVQGTKLKFLKRVRL